MKMVFNTTILGMSLKWNFMLLVWPLHDYNQLCNVMHFYLQRSTINSFNVYCFQFWPTFLFCLLTDDDQSIPRNLLSAFLHSICVFIWYLITPILNTTPYYTHPILQKSQKYNLNLTFFNMWIVKRSCIVKIWTLHSNLTYCKIVSIFKGPLHQN